MQPAHLSAIPLRIASSIQPQQADTQGVIRPTARYGLEIPQEHFGAFQPVPQASKARSRGFMIRELIEQ